MKSKDFHNRKKALKYKEIIHCIERISCGKDIQDFDGFSRNRFY